MNQFNNYSQLEDLTFTEAQQITAGESAWYWIAYGIGSVGRGFAALWKFAEEHPEEFIA